MNYEKITRTLYRIEVPLPGSSLRSLNAYLIKGSDRHLLVDNGFNMPECEKSLRGALAALDVKLNDTDFFISHSHTDHNGLTSHLLDHLSSRVYCSKIEGEVINKLHTGEHHKARFSTMQHHGMPAKEVELLKTHHAGSPYGPEGPLPFSFIEHGDIIDVGEHHFTVIHTPGHTPGHMTLFDTKTGIYLAADHILGTVTPNIMHWDGVSDSLGNYLASLDVSLALNPSLTLPAHRAIVNNTTKRIEQLKKHHEKKLNETMRILAEKGPLDAYSLASCMRWSIRADSWDKFSVQQRFFATGETLARLERLETLEKVVRKEDVEKGIIRFSLSL